VIRCVLIGLVLWAPQALAVDQVLLLPVVATGKRADWRSAGRMEGQLNERYGAKPNVMTTTEAGAENAKLGASVIACKGRGSCLAGLLDQMNRSHGLYVQIRGKGRRAKITVIGLERSKMLRTWTGPWSGVDAATQSMMDEMLKMLEQTTAKAEAKEPEPSGPAMELAVMDLANQGGFTKQEIALVQGNIMGLMQQSSRFKSIVGGADLRAMMDLEQQKSALGCDDTSCLAELGGALGVPYLMTMSLGRFASQRVVNISILYVDEAQVKHRVSRIFETDMMLLSKLPSLIEELLTGAYGQGGKALKNNEFQVTAAQEAYAREKQASQARAPYQKPLVWVGVALLAGSGLGVMISPTDDALRTQRERYDTATLSQVAREWDDFDALVQQRQTMNIVVPSLVSVGGGALLWGLLSR